MNPTRVYYSRVLVLAIRFDMLRKDRSLLFPDFEGDVNLVAGLQRDRGHKKELQIIHPLSPPLPPTKRGIIHELMGKNLLRACTTICKRTQKKNPFLAFAKIF